MPQKNRLDVERDNVQGTLSRNLSNPVTKKPTLCSEIRKFLKFSKTDSSHVFLVDEKTSPGAFELTDLSVYGLKKYAKFTSTLTKSNTHVIKVTFPHIHVSANYEMVNFKFLSGKLNGNGEMDLIFNNLKVNILVSTVKDYRQNTLKKINPNIQLKYAR